MRDKLLNMMLWQSSGLSRVVGETVVTAAWMLELGEVKVRRYLCNT